MDHLFSSYKNNFNCRLTFSGKLVDSELEEYSAKFDADAGAFIIACKKEIPGEHFSNLDLLTMLLAPQGATGVNRPSIEVIGGKYKTFCRGAKPKTSNPQKILSVQNLTLTSELTNSLRTHATLFLSDVKYP